MSDDELCGWIAIARTRHWIDQLKKLDMSCTPEEIDACYQTEKLLVMGAPRKRLIKTVKKLWPIPATCH